MSTSKIRSLDLCGLKQRIEKQDAAERVQQPRPEDYRLGFRHSFPEGHRAIDLRKLKDPMVFHFLTRNRSPWSC